MTACTFFGHSCCPEQIRPKLRAVVVDLIENHGIDRFYVGNHGGFDGMVHSVLGQIVPTYAGVQYAVVLSCVPTRTDAYDWEFCDTIVPDGIELVPPRFGISWRNKWMIRQAEYVVTYVTHSFGGAAQFAHMAQRQGKRMIELGGL